MTHTDSREVPDSIRVEQSYLGKGATRRTVWAVRAYRVIGTTEVRETLGTYGAEATARERATAWRMGLARCVTECGPGSCSTDPCRLLGQLT